MIKHFYMSFSGEFGVIPEDIMYLLAEGEKQPKFPGTHQGMGMLNVADHVRDATISWLSTQNAFEILRPFVEAANDLAGWKYDLHVYEGVQITQYEPGQHYTWHIDGNSDHFSARTLVDDDHTGDLLLNQTRDKNMEGLVRKLSVVVQLSDSDDYEGGDLFLSAPQRENLDIYGETLPQFREKGAVIVFPSYIRHKVTPVTKGIRRSAVAWVCGPPFR